MAERGVVLHVPGSWLEAGSSKTPPFYQKLQAGFDAAKVDWRCVPIDREQALKSVQSDDKFHIFNHGQVHHARALNAGIAYVYPFWNLDPLGIRAQSSITNTPFRPGQVDAAKSKVFFGHLRDRWVSRRQSRYNQPEAREALPAHAIAVFFQDESHRGVRETCYMDRWSMLQTVLQSWPGPVVVKPHPLELDRAVFERLLKIQKKHPQLHISQGNIHDILTVAARVVTINSAVGIEAYMHRKQVVLCGQADFHHIADIAHSPAELSAALAQAPRGRVYAKYLYWYFAKNCIDAGRSEQVVAQQVLRRINGTGYALAQG